MSRTERMILLGTALVVVLIIVLDAITPREPDWRPGFSRFRTDPYACGLVYDRLHDLFPQGVRTVREPIYGTAGQRLHRPDGAPAVNHLFIEPDFSPDALDREHLLRMVAAGDDAFIACSSFQGGFTDSLGIELGFHWNMPGDGTLAEGAKALLSARADTLRFTVWPLRRLAPAVFARGELGHFFRHFPTDSVQVLAENTGGKPVLLRIRHGRGHLWLCSVPLAFTNYYLLKDEGRDFMARAFSLLPDRPVLWDEYYKAGRAGSSSPLRYILGQPALKAAYWTAIALLLLTVLVHARRRQRAIPVLEPPRNGSRDLAETIARLYYFHGDHADLARKLIGQFKEEVRRRLRLPDKEWSADTVPEIARRTGITEEELHHARRLMEHFEQAAAVPEEQLITLNKTLARLRGRL